MRLCTAIDSTYCFGKVCERYLNAVNGYIPSVLYGDY